MRILQIPSKTNHSFGSKVSFQYQFQELFEEIDIHVIICFTAASGRQTFQNVTVTVVNVTVTVALTVNILQSRDIFYQFTTVTVLQSVAFPFSWASTVTGKQ